MKNKQAIQVKLAENQRIETLRLILREPRYSDYPDMYAYASDPSNLPFVWPAHKTINETKTVLATNFLASPLGKWFIEDKASHRMIGTIDFVKLDEVSKTCEIGYVLNKAYWGKGLMTESLIALSTFVHSDLGFQVQVVVDRDNLASQRVAEKSGFVLQAQFKAKNHHTGEIRPFIRYVLDYE